MKKILFTFLLTLGLLFAYDAVGGGTGLGYNCSDCTDALNDNSNCSVEVQLATTIADNPGTCINNPANFSNKTFNCLGNTIDGDDSVNSYGIVLMGGFTVVNHNSTIKNCRITDFERGIWLHLSANNTLDSDIVESNLYGVYLSYTLNNSLIYTTAAYNEYAGIRLDTSSHNNISGNNIYGGKDGIVSVSSFNNEFSYNQIYDNNGDGFYLSSSSNNNSFISNEVVYNNGNGFNLLVASDNTFNFNNVSKNGQNGFYADSASTRNTLDSNVFCKNNQNHNFYYDVLDSDSNFFNNTTCNSSQPAGLCNNSCSYCYNILGGGICEVGSPQIADCTCLNEALDDNSNCYNEVRLIGSISNNPGRCVDNPRYFVNKTLNCLGNTIDGNGLERGIFLSEKTGDTIKNCIIQEFEEGIHGEKLNNTVFQDISTVNNSGRSIFGTCTNGYGIFLVESNNITLRNINASSNHGGRGSLLACSGIGVYLNISDGLLTNNITATYNTGGTATKFGGGGMGIVLEGSRNTKLMSITASSNSGGGGTFSGSGIGLGIMNSDGIYLNHIDANNNMPGSKPSESSYGIYIFSSYNITLLSGNTNSNRQGVSIDSSANLAISSLNASSNRYGIRLFSSENNSIIRSQALDNYYHGIYIDSNSINNTFRSNRFCNNNLTGGDYYDVYDEDSNIFELNTCNTSSPVGLCTYSCTFVLPSQPSGGKEKRHKLVIDYIEDQYAKVGETKNITVFVENRGSYRENDVMLSAVCPESFSCGNASLGTIGTWDIKNGTISITGTVPGRYLLKAEARNDNAYAYQEFYFTVLPECMKNNDCDSDRSCKDNKCVPIECDCGYVQDHACITYECCADSDCDETSKCIEHKCVPIECDCGYVQDHACITYECCADSDCRQGLVCTSDHKCVKVDTEKEETTKEQPPTEEPAITEERSAAAEEKPPEKTDGRWFDILLLMLIIGVIIAVGVAVYYFLLRLRRR
ncbi:MAG: NosD domain-containing protein [Candidatus Bilamarchaeaceae archaeon]